MGIIDDSHPFFELTAFVPSSVLKVASSPSQPTGWATQ